MTPADLRRQVRCLYASAFVAVDRAHDAQLVGDEESYAAQLALALEYRARIAALRRSTLAQRKAALALARCRVSG